VLHDTADIANEQLHSKFDPQQPESMQHMYVAAALGTSIEPIA
jgi:hypothetical protein